MGLKIYKKTPVLRNTLLFVLFSILFIYVLLSFSMGVSVLSKNGSIHFLTNNWWFVLIALLTYYNVAKIKKYSLVPLVFFYILTGLYASWVYFTSFDKGVLILSFLYLSLGFHHVLFYAFESARALFRPGFSSNFLNRESVHPVRVVAFDSKGFNCVGEITNWSSDSFFALFNGENLSSLVKKKIKFEMHYDDHIFTAEGRVLTAYENGYGVEIISKGEKSSFDWQSLYNIIQDKGITPHYNKV